MMFQAPKSNSKRKFVDNSKPSKPAKRPSISFKKRLQCFKGPYNGFYEYTKQKEDNLDLRYLNRTVRSYGLPDNFKENENKIFIDELSFLLIKKKFEELPKKAKEIPTEKRRFIKGLEGKYYYYLAENERLMTAQSHFNRVKRRLIKNLSLSNFNINFNYNKQQHAIELSPEKYAQWFDLLKQEKELNNNAISTKRRPAKKIKLARDEDNDAPILKERDATIESNEINFIHNQGKIGFFALKDREIYLYLVEEANQYNNLHDYENALNAATQAIKIIDNNHLAYRERSMAHKGLGNLEKALADANQAEKLNPRNNLYTQPSDNSEEITEIYSLNNF